jgi:hypothetical protein
MEEGSTSRWYLKAQGREPDGGIDSKPGRAAEGVQVPAEPHLLDLC